MFEATATINRCGRFVVCGRGGIVMAKGDLNDGRRNDGRSLDDVLSAISLKSLVSGFSKYRTNLVEIWKYKGQYFSNCAISRGYTLLNTAIITYLYGVAISFVLYLPFVLKHGLQIDKVEFLLQMLYLQVLLVLLVTLSARIFGGRGSI